MKLSLASLASFALGLMVMWAWQPKVSPANKQIISIDSEKTLPARDMINQYQKFYKTFESFQTWDKDSKSLYLEQNALTEEFIKLTEKYFKDSVKAGKSIKVEEIK